MMTTFGKLIELVMSEITVIDMEAGRVVYGRLEHSPTPEMMLIRAIEGEGVARAAFNITNIIGIDGNEIKVKGLYV